MKIKIVSRWNSETVIFETDAENIGAAVEAAIAAKINLSGADLSGADLSDAYLSRANLSGADLSGAYLSGANLSDANLSDANLSGAYLSDANLSRANLSDAYLSDADLSGANLSGADLSGANLSGADLSGADLSDADLSDADLKKLLNQRTILPEGDLIGWKKLQNGVLCKLQIPAKAKRVGGLIGRKCRAEFAIVLEGEGNGLHNGHIYKVGKTVKPDKYDPNPMLECSNGIHFFITKQEAQAYT
jgi:hypothetical protein